jgi:hypothetical protein
MAAAMGIEILTEAQYRELQMLGEFDTKTSSWVQTPPDIRQRGGAIFCDRRYDHVFTYHNGAESYYAARAFRGALKVQAAAGDTLAATACSGPATSVRADSRKRRHGSRGTARSGPHASTSWTRLSKNCGALAKAASNPVAPTTFRTSIPVPPSFLRRTIVGPSSSPANGASVQT